MCLYGWLTSSGQLVVDIERRLNVANVVEFVEVVEEVVASIVAWAVGDLLTWRWDELLFVDAAGVGDLWVLGQRVVVVEEEIGCVFMRYFTIYLLYFIDINNY